MSGLNKFIRFADDAAASVLSDADYAADTQRAIGNQTGMYRALFNNKVLRQCSAFVSGFGSLLASFSDIGDFTDSMTNANIVTVISAWATTLKGNFGTYAEKTGGPVDNPVLIVKADAGKLLSIVPQSLHAASYASLPALSTVLNGDVFYFMGNPIDNGYSINVITKNGEGAIYLRNVSSAQMMSFTQADIVGFYACPTKTCWYVLPIDYNPA